MGKNNEWNEGSDKLFLIAAVIVLVLVLLFR